MTIVIVMIISKSDRVMVVLGLALSRRQTLSGSAWAIFRRSFVKATAVLNLLSVWVKVSMVFDVRVGVMSGRAICSRIAAGLVFRAVVMPLQCALIACSVFLRSTIRKGTVMKARVRIIVAAENVTRTLNVLKEVLSRFCCLNAQSSVTLVIIGGRINGSRITDCFRPTVCLCLCDRIRVNGTFVSRYRTAVIADACRSSSRVVTDELEATRVKKLP